MSSYLCVLSLLLLLLLLTFLATQFAWPFFRSQHETLDAHCGYLMPLSPWRLIPAIQGGSDRHSFHHSHNTGCYGMFAFPAGLVLLSPLVLSFSSIDMSLSIGMQACSLISIGSLERTKLTGPGSRKVARS